MPGGQRNDMLTCGALRREDLGQALSALPERARSVIELRFGLDGGSRGRSIRWAEPWA